jgi:hypothetical protein
MTHETEAKKKKKTGELNIYKKKSRQINASFLSLA